MRRKTTVKAVNEVSFTILPGEILGVVGESGCGKSTLARAVLDLYPPDSGEIYYQNSRIDNLTYRQLLPFRKKMQMIFQDPYASLNPHMTVKRKLEEPFLFHNKSATSRKSWRRWTRSCSWSVSNPAGPHVIPTNFQAVRGSESVSPGL